MKNKFYKLLFAIVLTVNFALILYSDEIDIKTTEINILENGKLLTGNNGFNIISTNNIEISGNSFSYNKETQELNANGNIKVVDDLKEITINSEVIEYKKIEEKFFIKDETVINYKNKYTLFGKDIIYLKNENKIFSENKIKIVDKKNNILLMDDFEIDQLTNIISGNNALFKDNLSNDYSIEKIKFNLNSKDMVGKDFYVDLGDENLEKQIYRFKGRAVVDDVNQTTISKGVFTTCKKTDGCPPWRIEAEEIRHDKKEKLMHFKNAWLKIYDFPVLYFPRFFYPDPTVDRQSGFLFPSFSDSKNLGGSVKLPYYKAISDNKDLTFSPRFFEDNKTILQTEYRQVNKNSYHTADFSFFNHDTSSKSHFYYNSKYDLDSKNFDKSFLEINLQNVIGDTYLSAYNISSPLINSETILDSYVDYNAYNEDFSINIYSKVIEDISKDEERFEFIYPYFDISKSYNNLTYSLNGYNKKFNTNQDILEVTNKIFYSPEERYYASGLKSDWGLTLRNKNNKINKASGKETNDIKGELNYDIGLPLINRGEIFNSIIDPKILFRYSPNKNENSSNDEKRLDYNNIFGLDRIATIEGGGSATIGLDYKLINKETDSEFLKVGLAQVFRNEENKDLPETSSVGHKSSDIFGNITLLNKDIINLDYIFNLADGITSSRYESIDLDLNVNKFVTSFEYLDDEIASENINYLTSTIKYNLDNNHSLSFSRRDNKRTDITEYNNLIYEYRNDCMRASVEYKKRNYINEDIKPEEELMFTITLGSFGKVNSPTY